MNARDEDAAEFRDECLKWQKRLNLLDWTLTFKVEASIDNAVEALCTYDVNTREATLTYYTGVKNVSHPKDNALHEMLHLRMADMLAMDEDELIEREEHKIICVLEKVIK